MFDSEVEVEQAEAGLQILDAPLFTTYCRVWAHEQLHKGDPLPSLSHFSQFQQSITIDNVCL
jgi:hypothetical protein